MTSSSSTGFFFLVMRIHVAEIERYERLGTRGLTRKNKDSRIYEVLV
jgi:hypothetical protein